MSTKNCTNCDPIYIEKCDKDICDIEVPANCVIVNEKYPCIGINTKPTKLSVFLKKLVDYLCNLVLESSCTVSVSADDDCCDYLANKFEDSDTVTKEIVTDLDGCQKIKFNSTSCTVAVSEDDTCCGYLEDKFVSDTLDIETVTDLDGCQKIQFNSTDEKVKVNSNDTTSEFLIEKFVDGAVSPFLDTSIPTAPKIKFLFKTITFTSRYNASTSLITVSDPNVLLKDGRGTAIVGEYNPLSAKYIGWSEVAGSNTYNGVDEPILIDYDFSVVGSINPEGVSGSLQADNCMFELADGVYNITISGSLEVKTNDPQGVFIWYLQTLQSNFSTTTCRLPLVREVVLTTYADTEESVLFAGEIKGVVFPLLNSNCGGGSLPINRILMRIINATDKATQPNEYDGISITFEKIG